MGRRDSEGVWGGHVIFKHTILKMHNQQGPTI